VRIDYYCIYTTSQWVIVIITVQYDEFAACIKSNGFENEGDAGGVSLAYSLIYSTDCWYNKFLVMRHVVRDEAVVRAWNECAVTCPGQFSICYTRTSLNFGDTWPILLVFYSPTCTFFSRMFIAPSLLRTRVE